MSDTEESAWLTAATSSEPNADFPLQYAAVFAECQPTDGRVALSRLGGVLARAQIPNEASAHILANSAEPGSLELSEDRFFWALAQAAALQHDTSHAVPSMAEDGTLPLPQQLHGLELNEAPKDHIFERDLEYYPACDYQLNVSVHAKDAGSFMMKHALYSVDGNFQGKQVKCIHRFRDFSDLYKLIQTKYPFRTIPILPPKRLALNGVYLVGDSQEDFLDKRASALTRFLHLITQHPIFSTDDAVASFLMVRFDAESTSDPATTEALGSPDEFSNITASPLFISQWSESTWHGWQAMHADTIESFTQVTQLCMALHRQIQRTQEEKQDLARIGRSSLALARSLDQAYPILQDDLPGIQQRLEYLSTHIDSQSDLVDSGSHRMAVEALEQLKLYRDMLASVLDLFKRHKQLARNSIPELQKKIATAQRKLATISTSESPKEEELHRQRTLIQSSQTEIRVQTNRDWLIKMVMSQELQMVQTMQYQLSRFLRSFGLVQMDTIQQEADLAAKFADQAGTAPLGPNV